MVWSHGNKNVGMHPASIQLEFEQVFIIVVLLRGGWSFVEFFCRTEA